MFFSNLPIAIYFLDYSNSFLMHAVQVLWSYPAGEEVGSVLTPPNP